MLLAFERAEKFDLCEVGSKEGAVTFGDTFQEISRVRLGSIELEERGGVPVIHALRAVFPILSEDLLDL